MRDAALDEDVVVCAESLDGPRDLEHDAAREDVDHLLEGVEVASDVAACLQLGHDRLLVG